MSTFRKQKSLGKNDDLHKFKRHNIKSNKIFLWFWKKNESFFLVIKGNLHTFMWDNE